MVSGVDFRDLSPMLGDLVGSRMSPKVISPSDDYFDGLYKLRPFFSGILISQFLFHKYHAEKNQILEFPIKDFSP